MTTVGTVVLALVVVVNVVNVLATLWAGKQLRLTERLLAERRAHKSTQTPLNEQRNAHD